MNNSLSAMPVHPSGETSICGSGTTGHSSATNRTTRAALVRAGTALLLSPGANRSRPETRSPMKTAAARMDSRVRGWLMVACMQAHCNKGRKSEKRWTVKAARWRSIQGSRIMALTAVASRRGTVETVWS